MKKGLEIIPVSRMDEVVRNALVTEPEPIEWEEPQPSGKEAQIVADEEPVGGLTAH